MNRCPVVILDNSYNGQVTQQLESGYFLTKKSFE
jgi:hypothetical protein